MPIKIQENISLSKYTSFKIGGLARYFCAVENITEIKEALEFAGKNKLKIFVLGGGSNLLVSDSGFKGLVIKIQDTRYKIQTNNEIFAGCGLSLAKLVSESVKAGLTGLEWAAGIPGTVGGAVCNNSGAYGKCMGDVVEEVKIIRWLHSPHRSGAVEPERERLADRFHSPAGLWNQRIVEKLKNKQCQFSYRDSIFKREKKYIILNVVLKLKKKGWVKKQRENFRISEIKNGKTASSISKRGKRV